MYISETLANGHGKGRYLAKRYIDIIEPPKEDERTSEDIISRLKEKLLKI